MAGMGMTVSAQYQLTNPGFDGDWSDIKPYTGGSSTTVGTTPSGWCVANVAGYKAAIIGWTGSTIVGSKVSGHTDYACHLENESVMGNVIPGYVTLGTSWNTANTSGGNADGGSFGGVSFTGTPDAIEFWYKRTAADNSQPASVVAYMWKGSTSQASVPVSIGSSPTKKTMENRDRNILGMEYSKGGDVTYDEDFSLIASLMSYVTRLDENNQPVEKLEHIIQLPDEKTAWTKATYEFTYHNNADKPEMINVVFGAMDYFTDRSNHKPGNTLTVDDVKFLYYSELATATYKGNTISPVANGTITVEDCYDASKLTLTSNGHGATIEKSYNEEDAKLTITVNGEDISVNEENFHTYTIQFAKRGDVNGDGQVTIADVTALVNIILGKDTQKAVADVNDDGSVTIADVTALVNIILGK